MKKSISLLLVLALILAVFALVGCGGEEGSDDETLSVCVVVSSAFGDKSFNDSALEGAEKLQEEKEIDVSYIECNNENIKQNLMEAAESADIVVAVGWECYDIGDVAPEYPDTKFIWVDNTAEGIEEIPNLLCITYAQNEGSFLAGYIAANMSKTGVIGAVGGEDDPVVNDFFAGYMQGAQYANPEIQVETIYAGDYENPALGKECAASLADRQADIVFNVAGNTGNGIFAAAKEGGFYAIGVDEDQKITNPEYDDVIICSMTKDIGQSIYDVIVDYMENQTWNGARVWETDMATGYVSITYGDEESTQQIGDELKAKAQEITAQIVAGEIEVENFEEEEQEQEEQDQEDSEQE